MTEQQIRDSLSDPGAYIDLTGGCGKVCLDGWFDVNDLENIAKFVKENKAL